MAISIAHLGPIGTHSESAAFLYADWHKQTTGQQTQLSPYPTIAQSIRAVVQGKADIAVVPVENSVEGGVAITLDTLWQLDTLQIQQALILPIVHALISRAPSTDTIKTIYSHPQALAQCQGWLEKCLPDAQLIPTNSTADALQHLEDNISIAAIAAPRAAELYNIPVLFHPINDQPDNCTRFWVLGLQSSPGGDHTSLAFSVLDSPGALVKPLQIFADRTINLSRIESRPTKRSLGDYLFFVDLEANIQEPAVQSALTELAKYTETLKVFGSYTILPTGSLANA